MKRLLELLAALLIVGVLGSCDLIMGPNEPVGSGIGSAGGTLSISFGEGRAAGSRAITTGAELPGEVLAGMSYKVVLTGPGGEVIELTVSGGETINRTVAAGQWRIDAQGYYLDALAGTGSVTLVVQAGDNPVRIPMMMSGPCYEVSADPGIEHGTVQTNFALAFEGTPVTLTAAPDEGYVLKDGTLAYNGNVFTSGLSHTFTMPAGDVRVSAEFEPLYNVTVAQLTGGTVIADIASAVEGTVITLSVVPASGYALKAGTLRYNGNAISGPPYTFSMPASDVTLSAEFVQFVRYVTQGGAGNKGGTSWADASDDLQVMVDALAAAPSSYTGPRIVKVAAGTYKPKYKPNSDGTINPATAANDRDSVFILRQGVQVWGGYPASGGDDPSRNPSAYITTLSGDFNGDDNWSTYTNLGENAYHVVLGLDIPAGSGTVLDGLTITGGNANATGDIMVKGYSISQRHGGGLYNHNSAPSLTNVVLSSSWAGASSNGGGGGMYNYQSSPALAGVTISGNISIDGGGMHNDASSPVLDHVVITGNGNGAGGGIYNKNGSSPVLTNVTISGNAAGEGPSLGGGGMYNTGSSPVLTNVTISGNTANSKNGGGMYNANASKPVLVNVTISGNSAKNGGGMYNDNNSAPVLTNVLISGNTVSVAAGSSNIFGGGMYNDSSAPVLTNVTISGNIAGGGHGSCFFRGGGMYNKNSTPHIRNSIIWGNAAVDGGGTGTVQGPGIYDDSSTPAISSSIVQDIDTTDPLFETLDQASVGSDSGRTPYPTTGGNYRLQVGSPAINMGSNGLYPANADASVFPSGLSAAAKTAINTALAKDLGGANRKNGTIDMGAYEKN